MDQEGRTKLTPDGNGRFQFEFVSILRGARYVISVPADVYYRADFNEDEFIRSESEKMCKWVAQEARRHLR